MHFPKKVNYGPQHETRIVFDLSLVLRAGLARVDRASVVIEDHANNASTANNITGTFYFSFLPAPQSNDIVG